MVQAYSLPRGLKPFVLRSFNAALKRCSTQKLVPKALLGKERIPPVGRNDKLFLEQNPPVGRNDKLSLQQVPPLRSGFALRSRCCGRDDKFQGGATLAEFAFTLPILVLILYGIFDFGSALVLKQKLEHVVYEAARAAASQSTDDLSNAAAGASGSVADLRDAVAQNLRSAGVNDCGLLGAAPSAIPPPASTWTYSVSGGGCPAPLVLTIRREDVLVVGVGAGAVSLFVSRVTLQYPFQYRSTGILQAVAGSSTFPTSVNLVINASMKNLL